METQVANIDLVFYKQGNYPQVWQGSDEKRESENVNDLVADLMRSPLFASGTHLSPRYYKENSLKTVSFLPSVCGEPLFFFNKDRKQIGVEGDDKVILRGAQLVEKKWVVYYSMPNDSGRLFGILYEIFQDRAVSTHSLKEGVTLQKYPIVIGGPNLPIVIASELVPDLPKVKENF